MPPYEILATYSLWAVAFSLTVRSISRISLREFSASSFLALSAILIFFAAMGNVNILLTGAVFGVTYGFRSMLFWLAQNHLFFEKTPTDAHGKVSFLQNAIPATVTIIALPLVGLLISGAGYTPVFILFSLISLYFAYASWKVTRSESFPIDWRAEMKKFKNLKTLALFDGALGQFGAVILPVYSLFFVHGEAEFGGLLAYLAFLSLAASYALASHSDRRGIRLGFLLPLSVLLGAVVLAMGFAGSFAAWLVLTTIYSIVYTVSYPLKLAGYMDVKKVDMGFWTVREFLFNLGRALTFTCAAAMFYFQLHWVVFALYAALFTAYPFVANRKLGIR